MEFCEVGRNFLEVLHAIVLVLVLYEVGILYILYSNLLHIRYLHEVVRKLPPGLRVVCSGTRGYTLKRFRYERIMKVYTT